MYELAEFLEPVEFLPWLLRVVAVVAGSYVVVWILALALSRMRVLGREDVEMRVHFGWLIPLTLQSVALTVIVLYLGRHFRDLDIPIWYCVAFLIPVLFSVVQGLEHERGISARLDREKQDRKPKEALG